MLVSVLGILCFVYESGNIRSENGNGVKDTMSGCLLCLLANFLFAVCDGMFFIIRQIFKIHRTSL